MITISLCMIVKNEEDVLARCLNSVRPLVDEIIVVDTGSTDQTREIAESLADQVYDFTWTEDFAAARNFAFQQGSCDYLMWLDADDVIEEEERSRFLKLKKELPPAVNVVMMKYNTGFDDQGNVTFSYYRERLIKNHAGMEWKGAIHEVVEPQGQVVHWDCAVSHRKLHPTESDRNLRIFENQIRLGNSLDPRQQFYYGRELYYHKRYEDAVLVFSRFLREDQGWLENKIDACCHLAYCLYCLGHPEEALSALFLSFSYDLPRAEVCCDIGRHFFDRDKYPLAAHWYKQALLCQRDDSRGGFTSPDCYGYLPCIQLCVCSSRMGDQTAAVQWNEQAALFKPDSPAVLHNRSYFAGQN